MESFIYKDFKALAGSSPGMVATYYNNRLCGSVRRTEVLMPLALTSQEKKVLGFLILMVGLGLVMLGVKRATAPKRTAGEPPSGAPAHLVKTP